MKRFSIKIIIVFFSFVTMSIPAMAEEIAVEETTSNNLSYPVIAVDDFIITQSPSPSFEKSYYDVRPNPEDQFLGLTAEEISWLMENGDNGMWYPQKTEGNIWQADFDKKNTADVTYIDWGDNIESVNPKLQRPFRLEVTLYQSLGADTMTAYTMAVLEYPSSTDELQGTNKVTYETPYATVISNRPKLLIQYLGINSTPVNLKWDGSRWITESGDVPSIIPVMFSPELNVAGKYVFGASQGGWTPDKIGWYRLTFYLPSADTTTGVNLKGATIANYSDDFTGTSEGTAATPIVDAVNNLTYVDVKVTKGGGEGRGRK